MFVVVVADIVVAMKTNNSVPLSRDSSSLDKEAGGLVGILQRVFLPHLAAGMGLFAVMAYATYLFVLAPLHWPGFIKNAVILFLLGGYGVTAFCYSFFAACVYALRLACVTWEEFIEETLDKVKDKAISRLDNMQDSLAKDQAKVLVRGSVREVYENSRRSTTLPRWVAVISLGALMLAVRAVLTARIVKLAGTTVKVSKIFAGKATLAGAIFLNLRLFSTLLLGVVYLVGGIVLICNVVFVLSW